MCHFVCDCFFDKYNDAMQIMFGSKICFYQIAVLDDLGKYLSFNTIDIQYHNMCQKIKPIGSC